MNDGSNVPKTPEEAEALLQRLLDENLLQPERVEEILRRRVQTGAAVQSVVEDRRPTGVRQVELKDLSSDILRLAYAIANAFKRGFGYDMLMVAQQAAREAGFSTAKVTLLEIPEHTVQDPDINDGRPYTVGDEEPASSRRSLPIFRVELGDEIVAVAPCAASSLNDTFRSYFLCEKANRDNSGPGRFYRVYYRFLKPCRINPDGTPIRGQEGLVSNTFREK